MTTFIELQKLGFIIRKESTLGRPHHAQRVRVFHRQKFWYTHEVNTHLTNLSRVVTEMASSCEHRDNNLEVGFSEDFAGEEIKDESLPYRFFSDGEASRRHELWRLIYESHPSLLGNIDELLCLAAGKKD